MNTSNGFLDAPGSGTHTYTIRAYNCNQSDANFTVHINAARADENQADDGRFCSSLIIQEVTV